MGCTSLGCGIARGPVRFVQPWNPNPLAMLMRGWQRGIPAVGTVDTSVADEAPCCDACALELDGGGPSVEVDVSNVQGGCASGACPTTTAGLKFPMGRRAGEVRIATDPELEAYVAAWARETGLTGTGYAREPGGRVRQAGRIMSPTARNFVRSNLTEIRAMSTPDLQRRRDALLGADYTTEVDAESLAVEQELDRRALGGTPSPGGGGGGSAPIIDDDDDESTSAAELSPAEWERKRRAIATAAARDLEPEDTARRDAIIARAMTSTFATFNQWLDDNYRTTVETIHGNTAITLAQMANDDRQRQREYNLQMNPYGNAPPGGGGGGGGEFAVGLGIVGLIAAVAK